MPSSENVSRWMEQANIDYFTQFIKAWIPFNAWYRCNYPDLNTDREIINEVKRNSNSFSNALLVLLRDTGTEGNFFRSLVSDLHLALQNHIIQNGDDIISFEFIIIEKNQDNIRNYTYRGVRYHIARNDAGAPYINIALTRSGNNIFTFQQSSFNIEELQNHRNFKNLTPERQRILLSEYKEINPYKPVSLLTRDEPNIIIGTYNFVNDYSLIMKGIIEVLYLLRCCLFHGELIPSGQAMNIYKPAYEILLKLISKIR